MRQLIHVADPDEVEEWKWMGSPVWSHGGILCTGETYNPVVKLAFANGPEPEDLQRLFNASLDGNVRRAIDILVGETVDDTAFQAPIRAAVALDAAKNSTRAKPPHANPATEVK